MRTFVDIRRERLKLLIDKVDGGNGAAFGRRVDKDRRQINAWLTYKRMSDRTAREIERKCLMPSGWLDNEESKETIKLGEPMLASSQSLGIDPLRMRDVQTLLGFLNELQAEKVSLQTDPDAIAATYDFLTELGEPVTDSNIIDFSKLMAERLKKAGDGGNEKRERSKAV